MDDVEAFLEHYGVKGMKWGERKTRFQKNRELNKKSKAAEQAKAQKEFNKLRESLRPKPAPKFSDTRQGKRAAKDWRKRDIDRARARVNSGAWAADWKDAKSQRRQDKIKVGSREARKILRKKKNALLNDRDRANEIRDGKERVALMLEAMAAQQRVIESQRQQLEAARPTSTGSTREVRYG